jgi:hypothetical protein
MSQPEDAVADALKILGQIGPERPCAVYIHTHGWVILSRVYTRKQRQFILSQFSKYLGIRVSEASKILPLKRHYAAP